MWKANRTAEQLARTSAKSYKMIVDYIVGLQERGVRFAREIFDGAARETGHQTESNRALTQELTERAEKQRDAFQTLVGESAGAYRDLPECAAHLLQAGPAARRGRGQQQCVPDPELR